MGDLLNVDDRRIAALGCDLNELRHGHYFTTLRVGLVHRAISASSIACPPSVKKRIASSGVNRHSQYRIPLGQSWQTPTVPGNSPVMSDKTGFPTGGIT
jgi:hypothetical protein